MWVVGWRWGRGPVVLTSSSLICLLACLSICLPIYLSVHQGTFDTVLQGLFLVGSLKLTHVTGQQAFLGVVLSNEH